MIYVAARSFSKTESLKARLIAAVDSKMVLGFEDPDTPLNHQDVISRASDCSILVLGRDRIDDLVLRKLPRLRHLVKYGVGLDNVDVSALRNRGIEFHWRRGVNSSQVAELTMGLALGIVRNISQSARLMRKGIWRKNGGTDLLGAKVCIVGCGSVGEKVARFFGCFGSLVSVVDIVDKSAFCYANGFDQVSLNIGLEKSDIVSLHVPLTSATKSLVGINELKLIGKSGYLINTSRGEVLEVSELKKALNMGLLAGVGLDVYEEEPFLDQELLSHPRVLCTPHIGGGSRGARRAMGDSVIRFIEEIIN